MARITQQANEPNYPTTGASVNAPSSNLAETQNGALAPTQSFSDSIGRDPDWLQSWKVSNTAVNAPTTGGLDSTTQGQINGSGNTGTLISNSVPPTSSLTVIGTDDKNGLIWNSGAISYSVQTPTATTLNPLPGAQPGSATSTHEWAASYGVGAFGGVGIGPSVAGGGSVMFGITSTGVVTITLQGSVDPVGVGAFAGAGVQGGVNYNWNPTAPNQKGDMAISAQLDGNAGFGEAVGGSIGISPDGIGGNSGVTRVGVGVGVLVSAGVSASKTWSWTIPSSVFPWNWNSDIGKTK